MMSDKATKTDKNIDVGLRLKQVRKLLGYSYKKMGETLGYSETYINYLESGKRTVTETVIERICNRFHVNPVWLNEGDGETFCFPGDSSGAVENEMNAGTVANADGHFGDRLRAVRRAFHISQLDIAKAAESTQANISYIEKNKVKPSARTIRGVETILPGINIQWLLNGTGEMFDDAFLSDEEKELLPAIEKEISEKIQFKKTPGIVEIREDTAEYDLIQKFLLLTERQKKSVIKYIDVAAKYV